MIHDLPKSLIEAAEKILAEDMFRECNFVHCFINEECTLIESFDYTIPDLEDVTHVARQINPENFVNDEKHKITHKKVEYSPSTKQVITTFRRDGAWEIHHQIDDHISKKLNDPSRVPIKFASHMYNWIKDKALNGESVRVVAEDTHIHNYHKLANKLKTNNPALHVTEIMPSIDPTDDNRTLFEFYVHHKQLKENYHFPYFLQFAHTRYLAFKSSEEQKFKELVEDYEEKLKSQGHIL